MKILRNKDIQMKNILSYFFLASIDTLERFSRICLIYGALHLALTQSGYRGSNIDLGVSIDKYIILILIPTFFMFVSISVFQHFYQKKKYDFRVVKSAKIFFNEVKKIDLPKYLSFSKFIVLGSTLLQYVFLISFLLVFGYYLFLVSSLLIILIFYFIFHFKYFKDSSLNLISPPFSQTILFLIHILVFALISFFIEKNLDILVILWLFALRINLLYFQQLFHVSIVFKENSLKISNNIEAKK